MGESEHMPKEGFSTITISSEMYAKIEADMNKANKKAGYRKYRSVTHFVEEAVINYKP
jgi:hypothetical protein